MILTNIPLKRRPQLLAVCSLGTRLEPLNFILLSGTYFKRTLKFLSVIGLRDENRTDYSRKILVFLFNCGHSASGSWDNVVGIVTRLLVVTPMSQSRFDCRQMQFFSVCCNALGEPVSHSSSCSVGSGGAFTRVRQNNSPPSITELTHELHAPICFNCAHRNKLSSTLLVK